MRSQCISRPLSDPGLAHDGDVVLRLAGDHAGAAAGAGRQVDRHPPLIGLLGLRVVENLERLILASREAGAVAILLQRTVERDRSTLDAGRRLGEREVVFAGQLAHGDGCEGCGTGGAEREAVHPHAACVRKDALSPVARGQGDDVVGHTRHHEHGRARNQRSLGNLEDVLVRDTQTTRRGRTDEGCVVPGQPSDGIGQLHEPGVVREPPIVDLEVGWRDELDVHGRRRSSRRQLRDPVFVETREDGR